MMDILIALKWNYKKKTKNSQLLILAILDIFVFFFSFFLFQLLPFCEALGPGAITWHGKMS